MNQLLTFWTIDLVSLLLLAGLGLLYGFVSGWRLQPGAGRYFSGLLLLAFAQMSPLHVLGMHYLLSAGMVAHLLLLLVCAPLLVLGLPLQPNARALPAIRSVSRFFQQHPWTGWLVCLVTMWFWHVPGIHDAMTAQPLAYHNGIIPLCTLAGTSASTLVNLLHIVQPVSLVLAGVCFVWPILGPLPTYRVHPLMGVAYLATACVGCSLLGMLITFAPVGLYTLNAGPDYYGIGQLVRQNWGFDRATDQQTAGLLMWVPGCFIYLSGSLFLLMNWLSEKELTPQRT